MLIVFELVNVQIQMLFTWCIRATIPNYIIITSSTSLTSVEAQKVNSSYGNVLSCSPIIGQGTCKANIDICWCSTTESVEQSTITIKSFGIRIATWLIAIYKRCPTSICTGWRAVAYTKLYFMSAA